MATPVDGLALGNSIVTGVTSDANVVGIAIAAAFVGLFYLGVRRLIRAFRT